MQNSWTARYRQVHNKIKDGRVWDLKSKFSKSIKEIRALSLLGQLPASSFMGRITNVGTRIAESPYGKYLRRSWSYRYWTVGLIVCLPVLYQFQTMLNSQTGASKLELVDREIPTESKVEIAHEGGNVVDNSN